MPPSIWAEEALDKLENGIEPQLIVIFSDINMPGMDGLALLREIKERRPDLPVMMVTAYGDDERRRREGEYGAAEFITKPGRFCRPETAAATLARAADVTRATSHEIDKGREPSPEGRSP